MRLYEYVLAEKEKGYTFPLKAPDGTCTHLDVVAKQAVCTPMTNPESQFFGDRPVDPAEKTRLVRGVFDSVAGRYDLMNDLMSAGVHRLWKDTFAARVAPRAGEAVLDVAGGTGDIAFRLAEKADRRAQITVCDLTPDMLAVGRDRAVDRGLIHGIDWVTGNAEDLPFPSNSFDVYTIAFGLRNVTRIDAALAEARRVLRPGGRFFCLEFSHVVVPVLKQLYDAYSYGLIPRIGQIVAKDRDSYQYLVESIRQFPTQENLAGRMETAGLERARWANMTGGIVAIHSGWRI